MVGRSLLEQEQFKLQFAGHETFPLRYGWLKKAYDAVTRAGDPEGPDPTTIFSADEAIAYFGVGKNMVVSMRHWALASGVLTDAGPRGAQLVATPFGRLILGAHGDPYLEHPASLWLIHWHYASRPDRTTTWYWAFNELHEPTFDRDLLRRRIMRRCEELRESGRMKESRITETTIRRDVECFIRTYLAKSGSDRGAHEDNLECPLTELSLIQSVGVGGALRFRRGPKPTLPDEVFLFGLITFWHRLYPARREFSVEAVTHEPGSPGRVFLLDEESVADRLARMPDLTAGALGWDESTGMRQIYAHDLLAVDTLEYLARYYRHELHSRAA